VNVGYDTRISQVVDSVIDYEAAGAARVKDTMVSVFSTWAVEIGSGECSCVKGGSEDSFAFAICALMDHSIIDIEIANVLGDAWSMVHADE